MYRPEQHIFAFRLRRWADKDVLEGVSGRYTAIALIGLATELEQDARDALRGQDPQDVCGRLVDAAEASDDIGQVALTLWAARAWDNPKVSKALERLKRMDPVRTACPTVELSWCLAALSIGGGRPVEESLARAVAGRLLAAFRPQSSLFSHWPADVPNRSFRSHVACFADLVYPIQSLSHYGRAAGCSEALQAARACAQRMAQGQGPAGQWWWHHDIRTHAVIEGYPVYAVHQDGMAPMALRAVRDATGDDHTDAIRKGLDWLWRTPEIGGRSLIDRPAGVIWRKVARREPGKISRALQAAASRVHPRLRLPVGWVFRPGKIDFESRPYHMGWLLHAFQPGRW